MHQTFNAALEMNLLHANQQGADENRDRLNQWGITCLNLMSSPGSGKTQLLSRTLQGLQRDFKIAVIEGDMTTQLDAQRLRQQGVPVVAINTGRSCHLDSKMVAGGLHQFSHEQRPEDFDLMFVENVGNLVCPAEFEVGEHAKVALLSITEGEDKPLKYPIMFREADCLLITKMDLSPYLEVNIETIVNNVRQLNSKATIIPVSAKSGEGLEEWFAWIKQTVELRQTAEQTPEARQAETKAKGDRPADASLPA